MNDIESYQWLAIANSKEGRPRRKEEIDLSLPYFEIFKDPMGRYDIRGSNYETHDNAPRMMLWEDYMKRTILPQIRTNISGFYNIELHDSYTYLDKPKDKYRGCLTFSKFKEDRGPVVIPDPYAMQNWGGALATINDPMNWSDKIHRVCFFGTTTGKRIPSQNQRLEMCIWSLRRPDLYDFKITKIAQIPEHDVFDYLGSKRNNIISAPVSPVDQMKYKYHLMLDGNTCRFDIWNFLTNSITLKYESKEMLWYYPLLIDGVHFKEVNMNTLEQKMHMTEREAEFMIESSKRCMRKIAKPLSHMFYLSTLFENMALNGA